MFIYVCACILVLASDGLFDGFDNDQITMYIYICIYIYLYRYFRARERWPFRRL